MIRCPLHSVPRGMDFQALLAGRTAKGSFAIPRRWHRSQTKSSCATTACVQNTSMVCKCLEATMKPCGWTMRMATLVGKMQRRQSQINFECSTPFSAAILEHRLVLREMSHRTQNVPRLRMSYGLRKSQRLADVRSLHRRLPRHQQRTP